MPTAQFSFTNGVNTRQGATILNPYLSGMTVSMRVMSAGDGYKYLLRSVVAGVTSR